MKKINFILLSIFFISLAFLGTDAYANEFEWTSYEALNQGNNRNVIYGDGKFVIVSANGSPRVAVSEDGGKTWKAANFSDNRWMMGGTYAKGQFVIVGENRGSYSSKDGMNWDTNLIPIPAYQWVSVTYGKGKYVAVNYENNRGINQVVYSSDGKTWQYSNGATQNSNWQSVTYGNGRFVAVSGDGIAMYSFNGIDWNPSNAISEINEWVSVTYGNGRFVAVSASGTNRIMTSINGIDWELVKSPVQNTWTAVTYGGGYFVAVSFATTGWNTNEDPSKAVMISSDGINWTAEDTPDIQGYYGVAYGDGKFVAASWGGQGGASNKVLVGELINKGGNSSSNIFGTRFCTAGVTTFCRPQNGFVNNNPLISIYTELLGLYQQLLSALQNENS